MNKFHIIPLFLIISYLAHSQVTIIIDTSKSYQRFTGWEATSFITSDCDSKYSILRDLILPYLVDSIGITRLRLEVRSGSEHNADNYSFWLNNNCPDKDSNYSKWRESRYATINDNDNPFVLNPQGFFFTELDKKIENIVIPFIHLLNVRGIKPYINLCYVAFTNQIKNGIYIHNNPDEYSEFILAVFLHMNQKYGFTPDAVEIILEPDNVPQWNGSLIGQAIVKTSERLLSYGFKPKFIGPSTTNMANAIKFIDDIIKVPGALELLDEISYHRYGGVSQQNLKIISEKAKLYNKKTSMLEWWFDNANFKILHEDITIGNVSSFQQATINGFFDIDTTNPKEPKIKIKDISEYNRIYYTLIKPDAIRKEVISNDEAVSPIAVINNDNTFALIIISEKETVLNIANIPNAKYLVIVTNEKLKYQIIDTIEIYNHKFESLPITKGLVALKQIPSFNATDEPKKLQIKFFPNPASDYVQILFNTDSEPNYIPELKIYNVFGQCIMKHILINSMSVKSIQINISHLPNGIYYLQFANINEKFIIWR